MHALLLSCLLTWNAWPESDETLKVISYNVQFLPPLATFMNERGHPEYRARKIAEKVSEYDIVGLQETFHEEHRALLLEALTGFWGDDFQQMVSPKDEKRAVNGGCLILTRRPILSTNAMIFRHYSDPKDFGFRADGFAAKGVIHAKIARSEKERNNTIDVFVTHLEARADVLRPKQYEEMADFILDVSDPSTPCLILGDFNTRGNPQYMKDPDSPYHQLLSSLVRARPQQEVLDLWPELMGDLPGGTSSQNPRDLGRRIDYCFLCNPAPPHVRLKPLSIRVEIFPDDQVVALSDHNAVAVLLQWPAIP